MERKELTPEQLKQIKAKLDLIEDRDAKISQIESILLEIEPPVKLIGITSGRRISSVYFSEEEAERHYNWLMALMLESEETNSSCYSQGYGEFIVTPTDLKNLLKPFKEDVSVFYGALVDRLLN